MKNNTVRNLENKARKNDLKAIYELAQHYESGRFVDQDSNKSEELYDLAATIFLKQKIFLKSISLIDFKGIKHLNIDFSQRNGAFPNPIVLIGNNGSGKTTILEAIAKSLSWLVNRTYRSSNTPAKYIDDSEINNLSENGYASVVCQLITSDNSLFNIELNKSKDGSAHPKKNDLAQITQLASIINNTDKRIEKYDLPLFAYYSVSRATADIPKKEMQTIEDSLDDASTTKYLGNKYSLNGIANFNDFVKWFKTLTEAENNSNSNNLDSIKATLNSIETVLSKGGTSKDTIDALKDQLAQAKDNIHKAAQSTLEVNPREDTISKYLEVINSSVSKFMPEFHSLSITRIPFRINIFKGEELLDLQQLSQGEKSALALFFDITRRLILSNPSKDNPLEGSGTVLIDEIDLHLHPSWQQQIVNRLRTIFPKIQFILTTHSPHVLTSIEDESIFILTKDSDGEITLSKPQSSSYGEKSSHVLRDIMGVNPYPPISALDEYKEIDILLQSGNYKSNEFEEKFEKLRKALGERHSLIIKMKEDLRRIKVMRQ